MRRRSLSFFLLCAATLMACAPGDTVVDPEPPSEEPDDPAVAGTWKARDVDGDDWEVTLAGTETLTGTYKITLYVNNDEIVLTGDVTGTYAYPSVKFAMSVTYQDVTQACEFSGTMQESGTEIRGTGTCRVGGGVWTSALNFAK